MIKLFLSFNLLILISGHPLDISSDNKIDYISAYQTLPDPPKWFGHCKVTNLDNKLDSLISKLRNPLPIKELFIKIEKSALIAMKRAEDIKKKFTDFEHIFNDFEELQFKSNFEWLPKIPPVSEEAFQDMTKEIAILTAHQYVERFAVAIEQILLDQELHSGYDWADKQEFKNIEDDNYSILCEIRLSMSLLFGSVNEHFITNTRRDVMPEEYRYIKQLSKRMLRDYLILRQYVVTTDYITNLIEYHRRNF